MTDVIVSESGPAACWAGGQDTTGHAELLGRERVQQIGQEAAATGVAYPKASRTAQWYADSYPGIDMGGVEKVLLHTTETGGWPAYGGGASMPNLTFDPRTLQWRQHQWCNWSARALKDPAGTVVQENRDKVCQVEIIACSDLGWADKYGYLRVTRLSDAAIRELGTFLTWCHVKFGVPIRKAPVWLSYPASYGNTSARMSGPTYAAFRGVLGHQHASGNSHGDPGSIAIDQIMAAAGPGVTAGRKLDVEDKAWLSGPFVTSIRQ
jgi:hypothetical protein